MEFPKKTAGQPEIPIEINNNKSFGLGPKKAREFEVGPKMPIYYQIAANEFNLRHSQSRAFSPEDGSPTLVEFLFSSDAASVVKHTKKVLILEDDDLGSYFT
ncbi:CFC_HP_G0007400.mRNA.1.CDS.1 [Saccharomyces cerevisiae]|nr:CFC_HP_G0007400.mRNA.1.CDS.1 [Saccharomyces cerevisiae]CAI6924181.1 CFC_HP_G0007400.mRNA.1.CDS.1 [Saccharomyces cerevisiae]